MTMPHEYTQMARHSTAHSPELFSSIQDMDAQALQGGGLNVPPDVLISRGFLAILLYNRLGSVPAYLISLKTKTPTPWA